MLISLARWPRVLHNQGTLEAYLYENGNAVKPGGRAFRDVCGEKSVQSIGGKKYMLMVRDEFTRFNAVYFIHSKDEVSKYFRQYLAATVLLVCHAP